MASCLLTTARTGSCTDTQGGLDYIEFADFGTLGDITYDSGSLSDNITDMSGSTDFYKYELNSTANNYVENITSDEDAGTTYYEQVLTLSLKKLDAVSHKELKLVTYGRPHVKITDKNGNKFIMGLIYGAKVTAGTIQTGGAMGDFNGYNLTLTAKEEKSANFYTGT